MSKKQTYDNYYRRYYQTPSGKEALAKARRKYNARPEIRARKNRYQKRLLHSYKKKYQAKTQAEAVRRHRQMLELRKKHGELI